MIYRFLKRLQEAILTERFLTPHAERYDSPEREAALDELEAQTGRKLSTTVADGSPEGVFDGR